MDEVKGQVTRILHEISLGRADGVGDLLTVIYQELHAMARRQMASERAGHTLQPTALVHEAYLRLLGSGAIEWQNRAHFFAAAGEAMRRILVEQARRRNTAKRGGGRERLEFLGDAPPQRSIDESSVDVVALNEALSRLEDKDERMATIVKLRFFSELSIDEVANALNLSRRTVIREWLAAKAWLHSELVDVHNEPSDHAER